MSAPYLVDLIAATVKLRRRGRFWEGLCPFHNEKTPSFHIFQGRDQKWRWHCQGCHEKGDAIDWLMRRRGLTYIEAANEIGKPVRADPAALAARRAARHRLSALSAYRDTHIHCTLHDDAIDTRGMRVWLLPEPREPTWKMTDVELLDMHSRIYRQQMRQIRAENPAWGFDRHDCPLDAWASQAFVKPRS